MTLRCRLTPLFGLLLACWLTACDSGEVRRGGRGQREPAATGQATVRAPASAPATAAPPPPPSARGANEPIEWPSSLPWHDYETGLRNAKRDKKPVMVLVYADWCPKCRALAPVLARDDVHDLARRLVVVRQNQDEAPPWLEALADEQGNYVPRIIFLDAEGAPLRKLTSGHPRYPFFYAADRPDALVASLKRALAI